MHSDLPSPAAGHDAATPTNRTTLHDALGDGLSFPLPRLPFAKAWQAYADAGLQPIPVTDNPPKGYQTWTRAQAERWANDGERWAYAQTALYIPDGYVVLDDDYANPVRDLEAELGARGVTLYGTSRGAGAARRKSIYRVPAGSRFGTDYRTPSGDHAGDIIDRHHRFMFVCPTVNRRTGEVEQWFGPDDVPLERFPTADDLAQMVADLPEPWLDFLRATARQTALVAPYDGPTRFQDGELSLRVQAVADRHPDTSHHPEANAALMALAWVAVRFPDSQGIATLHSRIVNAYILRTDARTPVPARQASMNRAWETALATQAAGLADEWAEYEAEFGPEAVQWYREHKPQSPTAPSGPFANSLVPDAYTRASQSGFTAFERAMMGDPAGYAEERAKQAQVDAPSSWAPLDLSAYWAEGYEAPKPTIFRRTDGMGMFYPGVVNEFHAKGGTGKTMVALAMCVEALRDGDTVVYVDYEEHPGRISERLRAFGVSEEVARSRFHYVKPSEMPDRAKLDALSALEPSVVIIDTFSKSFSGSLDGANSNSTDDVNKWFTIPEHFAERGACVMVTDHIPKDASNPLMPIGAQGKYANYKGAIYYLEKPTGGGLLKGAYGRLRLILAKDNGGDMGVPEGECAATFYLDATGDVSTWELRAPDTGAVLAEAAAALSAERERIALALTESGGAFPSRAKLWDALEVNKNSTPGLLAALADMIVDGSVIEEKNGNAHSLRLQSNIALTPEADAETDTWADGTTRLDHVPMSQVQAPGDKEDIGSDIHHVHLDIHLDKEQPSRSIFTGVSDAELDALLEDDHDTK